jgi:hypothetical protein
VEKGTSFVNQNPREPTTEGAFALEAWWIARSRIPAVSHGVARFMFTAKDANREEVE